MRMNLNTNMEMVGLREPYKATYKVSSKALISISHRAASISPLFLLCHNSYSVPADINIHFQQVGCT